MWNQTYIVGPIWIDATTSMQTDAQGNKYRRVDSWRPEYHLNVARISLTPAIAAFQIFPLRPRDRYAGDSNSFWTAHLVFKDETEARSVLGAYWITPAQAGASYKAPRAPSPPGLAVAAMRIPDRSAFDPIKNRR